MFAKNVNPEIEKINETNASTNQKDVENNWMYADRESERGRDRERGVRAKGGGGAFKWITYDGRFFEN